MTTTTAEYEALLILLAGAPEPSHRLDASLQRLFAGNPDDHWFDFFGIHTTDNMAPPFTASLDAARSLMKLAMPGWIYRVAECSVSDDAWLIPDFNDPVHGPEFIARYSVEHQRDPLREFGTDIDRRPPGYPALAMCMALVTAKIAVMKLEN